MSKDKKKELSDIRRILIQQVIAEDFQGNQSKFAEKSGKSVQQINNIIRNHKPAGDKVVSDIESALEKPTGWFSDSQNINPNFLNILLAQEKFEQDFAEIEGEFAQAQPENGREIPILTIDTVEQYLSGETVAYNHTYSTLNAGKGVFAFLMPDKSMFDPSAPVSFDKDDILLIAPEIKHLQSSDCALIQLKNPEHSFIVAQFYNNIRGQYFKQHQEDEILTLEDIECVLGAIIEKQKPLFDQATLQQKLDNQ